MASLKTLPPHLQSLVRMTAPDLTGAVRGDTNGRKRRVPDSSIEQPIPRAFNSLPPHLSRAMQMALPAAAREQTNVVHPGDGIVASALRGDAAAAGVNVAAMARTMPRTTYNQNRNNTPVVHSLPANLDPLEHSPHEISQGSLILVADLPQKAGTLPKSSILDLSAVNYYGERTTIKRNPNYGSMDKREKVKEEQLMRLLSASTPQEFRNKYLFLGCLESDAKIKGYDGKRGILQTSGAAPAMPLHSYVPQGPVMTYNVFGSGVGSGSQLYLIAKQTTVVKPDVLLNPNGVQVDFNFTRTSDSFVQVYPFHCRSDDLPTYFSGELWDATQPKGSYITKPLYNLPKETDTCYIQKTSIEQIYNIVEFDPEKPPEEALILRQAEDADMEDKSPLLYEEWKVGANLGRVGICCVQPQDSANDKITNEMLSRAMRNRNAMKKLPLIKVSIRDS